METCCPYFVKERENFFRLFPSVMLTLAKSGETVLGVTKLQNVYYRKLIESDFLGFVNVRWPAREDSYCIIFPLTQVNLERGKGRNETAVPYFCN